MSNKNSSGPQIPESEPRKDAEIKPRLLTIEQAAIYLGRTPSAVRELIYKGRLPAVRFDRRVSLDIHDLDRLIEQHKVTETVF